MDILAAPSSGPRMQDRAEPGTTTGGSGFASLLGALGTDQPEAPAPRRRPDEERDAAAAAVEAPAAPAAKEPAADRGTAARTAEDETPKPAGQAADATDASRDGKAAAGSSDGAGPATRADGPPNAAHQAAAQQAAGQLATAAAAAPSAADAEGKQAGPAAGTAAAAALAAAQPGAPTPRATAGAFRIAAQDGQLRGDVRLEAAGQAPRAALSGNTALAASLAASTDGAAQAGAQDAQTLGSGQKGEARIADGTAAKTFAGLAAEAAAQLSGQEAATGGGKTPVLQAPGGGEILLPAGLEAARPQVAQPVQASAAATPANPAPPSQAPMADQVAVQMHRALSIGKDRLSIQLHPAELGRVDIKLELAQDGPVRAVLQAERKDTMDLLQRDVRGLERALQNAGLQTDGNSISFDLRGGQQQRSGQGFAAPFASGDSGADAGGAEAGDGQPQPGRAEARHDGAVNIRV